MPISGIYETKGVGDVLGGRLGKGAVKPGEKVWQCSSGATKWSGRGPAFRKLIGTRCVTDATSRVPKIVFRKLWTIYVYSFRLCALTDHLLGALPRRWFSCRHHAQPVHPKCLHSGNEPSVRRAGKPRWPRGSEHVEDKCRRQGTRKTFIVEITEVHVMFLRTHRLGGRDVRVTMLGQSEVLRLHGRTCARRGVFHCVLGGASRTQRFIVRTGHATRMSPPYRAHTVIWARVACVTRNDCVSYSRVFHESAAPYLFAK